MVSKVHAEGLYINDSHGKVEEGISATVVRDALRSNLSLEGLVPKCVIDARFYLTEFILLHESTHN